MKFSEQWLREWVDPPVNTDCLTDRLTMAGLEVERIERCHPGFTGIAIARVIEIEQHPRANHLFVCRLDAGMDNTPTVVCGAENVQVNGLYPYARVGATLPDGTTIKEARIKGCNSAGMLCSGAELGLSDTTEALLVLDETARPGRMLDEYLALNDSVIEISLTPNRGDCLSIRGLAREIAAIHDMEFKPSPIKPIKPGSNLSRPVVILAPEACPRYAGRVIANISMQQTVPVWLTEKLRRSGIRTINPVVDITNFVMLELGQPLHAFDHDLLQGSVTVRYAEPGDNLVTLDGVRRELTPETLVIADAGRPVAIAGIMGGLDTGVTAQTRHIFLESAFFTPAAILGRPRHYGLRTDSSHRFERGVDYELQVLAIERATGLILELCGGQAGPVIDIKDRTCFPRRRIVKLKKRQIDRLLGFDMGKARVRDILRRLGMSATGKSEAWKVSIPSYRFDISLDADLIEEIARIHGYEHVPTAPIAAHLQISTKDQQVDLYDLRKVLVHRGYQEVITYSFIDPYLQRLIITEQATALSLRNPIATTMGVMRQSLWPGLLTTLEYNLKRQQQRVRIFEVGRAFSRAGGTVLQTVKIAGLAYGKIYPIQWDKSNRLTNFFDMKGDIEALLTLGGHALNTRYRPLRHDALHPGQSAEIILDNQIIGLCGALNPQLQLQLELPLPVMLFEIDYASLSTRQEYKYEKISKYPVIRRDISILVNKDIPVERIMNVIHTASPRLLINLELFDVYHGEGIDLLKKSLALSLTFQASSSTLTDEEVEGEVKNILTALVSKFDARLRE
jgi:phenylalanyl-tRNA synthetase beta chain